MGNINAVIAANSRFKPTEWTVLEHEKAHTIMRSEKTGLMADCYVLALSPKLDAKIEMEMYKVRRQANTGFVQVYQAELVDTSTTHCFSYERTIKVFTEHIPYRLSDFLGLSQNDSMYVLSHALRLFKQLYARIGYLEPSAKLICFNWKGELKVWVNEDLSANHPKVRHEFLQRAVTERDMMHLSHSEWQMIIKILELVERASEGGRIAENFAATLRANRALTFSSAISLLEDFMIFERITPTVFTAFATKRSSLKYLDKGKALTPQFPPDKLSDQSSLHSHRQASIERSSLRPQAL